MYFLIVLEVGRPRSWCPRFAFSWGLSPRLVDVLLPAISSLGLFSVHTCIPGVSSSSYKDTNPGDYGLTLWPHLTLITSFKGLSSNTVTWDIRASTWILWERGTVQSLTWDFYFHLHSPVCAQATPGRNAILTSSACWTILPLKLSLPWAPIFTWAEPLCISQLHVHIPQLFI